VQFSTTIHHEMKALARILAALAMSFLGDSQASATEPEEGFAPIFDGSTFAGWETPDHSFWEISDGAIVGRITKEHPCNSNQYLVWTGGEIADFELKLKSRLTGEGAINNGFQFRSRLLPDHDICGYQMDNNLQTPWLVRLYDEYGRHTLALRGERTAFAADGSRTTTKLEAAEGAPWFRLEDWHEYHLTCVGPQITLKVDGRLAAEVEDNDLRRFESQGVLALQLHSGPPTQVEFKDIRLKVLREAVPKPRVSLSAFDREREALLREAVAWWPLDTGGHGAKPRLRHIPDWEKFELNVRSAGPGARPGTDVVLLDGAYFDAGPELPGAEAALTVYLRARDPRGTWDAGLCAKGATPAGLQFRLFGSDLSDTPGPDIGFEVRTDQGFASVSFPVTRVDPTAWHDLVGRFDGRTVELFCDGLRMAGKPCTGTLVTNREPLLLGAETDGGKVVRVFRGEMEEVGLWRRALSPQELILLARKEPLPGWERRPEPK
jgi:hypothetical protein